MEILNITICAFILIIIMGLRKIIENVFPKGQSLISCLIGTKNNFRVTQPNIFLVIFLIVNWPGFVDRSWITVCSKICPQIYHKINHFLVLLWGCKGDWQEWFSPAKNLGFLGIDLSKTVALYLQGSILSNAPCVYSFLYKTSPVRSVLYLEIINRNIPSPKDVFKTCMGR